MHKLTELRIWNCAIDLATETYQATANFPKEEKFGLTSQIRRSAISIPSNIAEGAGRNSPKEFCHFLGISNGSSYELQFAKKHERLIAILNTQYSIPSTKSQI